MPTKSHTAKAAFASALALAACLAASPALAKGRGAYYSGSVYDPATNTTTTISRGPRGEARGVEPGNTLKRHRFDGPRTPVTGRMSGSLYDPETNTTTTTLSRGPTGEARGVEPGNTLKRHRFDGPMRPVPGRMSGSLYNPDTNTTTTIIRGPGMSGWIVAMGNLLRGY